MHAIRCVACYLGVSADPQLAARNSEGCIHPGGTLNTSKIMCEQIPSYKNRGQHSALSIPKCHLDMLLLTTARATYLKLVMLGSPYLAENTWTRQKPSQGLLVLDSL